MSSFIMCSNCDNYQTYMNKIKYVYIYNIYVIYIYIINNAASKAQGYCFAKSPLIKITLGLAVVVGMNKRMDW